MTTTDPTKTITTRSLVLRTLKHSILRGTAFARTHRAEGQRCLADARAARKAGDDARSAELIRACFIARGKASAMADQRRHTLLAYGFLRGRRYLQIEPQCAEGNLPSANWIATMIADHFIAEGEHGRTPTEAEIGAWFEAGAAPVETVPATDREAA